MPFGVALARSRVPSSRSAVSCWLMLTMPSATFIPTMLGRARVPSRSPLDPNAVSRMKYMTASINTGQKK
ncbi:MAG: hypothetical protein JWQ95_288 [Sphaerisporangium sp.]|nr:hypothetical protein [Sphaerisporangium sp.]